MTIFRTSLLLLALAAAGCGKTLDQEPWRLQRVEDRGFDDPENLGAVSLAAIGHRLYLGTWNTRHGCMIYRTADGHQWTCVSPGGLGRKNDFCAISLASHKGHLYAGTWNVKDGAGLHRARIDTAGQFSWQVVTDDGFGDRRNHAVTSLCAFRGRLYAGCYNQASGPGVWRSDTGNPGTWRQVNINGFGDARNSDATRLLEHDGHLYVTTEALRVPGLGCQIWRTDGGLEPPWDQWERVADNGFGNAENVNIRGVTVFKGRMYAATWNPKNGIEVWRGRPGGWDRVARGGFGDAAHYMSTALVVLDDTLFLSSIGGHGFEGNPFVGDVKVFKATGGLLMKTEDGRRWSRVDGPGFLRPPMLGAASLATFKGRLFIGAMALDRPLQIWAYGSPLP